MGEEKTRRVPALLARVYLIAAVAILSTTGCAADKQQRGDRAAGQRVAATAPTAVAATSTPASTSAPQHVQKQQTVPPAPTVAPKQFVRCDSNITVRAATTTCGLAQNVFYAFFMDADAAQRANAIRAYSPASRKRYRLSCETAAATGRVRCIASDGGEVRFDLAAMLDYNDEQAARYARTHDLGPGSDGATEDARGSSSDGYSSPDLDLRSGDEIPNYDAGRGYRIRCSDGMYSKSGGIQGACSGHGGEAGGPASSAPAPSYDPPSPSSSGTVNVDGYYRKDGTYVRPYTRSAPTSP